MAISKLGQGRKVTKKKVTKKKNISKKKKTSSKVSASAQKAMHARLSKARARTNSSSSGGSNINYFKLVKGQNKFRLLANPESELYPFLNVRYRTGGTGKNYREVVDLSWLFHSDQNELLNELKSQGLKVKRLKSMLDKYGDPFTDLYASLKENGHEKLLKGTLRTKVLCNAWTEEKKVQLASLSQTMFNSFFDLYGDVDEEGNIVEIYNEDLFNPEKGPLIITRGKGDGLARKYTGTKAFGEVKSEVDTDDLLNVHKLVIRAVPSYEDYVKFCFDRYQKAIGHTTLMPQDYGMEAETDEDEEE